MSGGRRQSEGLLRWIITQSDSWRHCASAAPISHQHLSHQIPIIVNVRISLQELGISSNLLSCFLFTRKSINLPGAVVIELSQFVAYRVALRDSIESLVEGDLINSWRPGRFVPALRQFQCTPRFGSLDRGSGRLGREGYRSRGRVFPDRRVGGIVDPSCH